MANIPKQKAKTPGRIKPTNTQVSKDDRILFSFARLESNEFFNLDATCENWSKYLLSVMKDVSGISKHDINAGLFSGKHSKLRVHPHTDASPPCPLPTDVELSEFYQIRFASSKGGMHGVFIDNVFYVIWLDPHHNMYPNENYGGLKKIHPPDTCCSYRESIIESQAIEIERLKQENAEYEEMIDRFTS